MMGCGTGLPRNVFNALNNRRTNKMTDQDTTVRMTKEVLDAIKVTARRQGFTRAIRFLYENGHPEAAQVLEKQLAEATHV